MVDIARGIELLKTKAKAKAQIKPPGASVYAGDRLYRGGAEAYASGEQSRGIRAIYLDLLKRGNEGKITMDVSAKHADAMAQGIGNAPAGANNTSAADELTRRTARTKGLSRLLMTTQNEGTSNLLKERLAAAQIGRQTQAAAIRGMAKNTEMGSGIQGGMSAVDAYNSASKSNAIGQLFGLGAGLGIQAWQNRAPTIPRGTAADLPAINWGAGAPTPAVVPLSTPAN